MKKVVGFNIAPHEDPTVPVYTISQSSAGLGESGEWTAIPTNISLIVEPYVGDTQFLLEWQVDDQRMTPDHLLNALQGIRQVAETLKIEQDFPISHMKITVTDGFQADGTARNVRLAAIQAFDAALGIATFVEVPRPVTNA